MHFFAVPWLLCVSVIVVFLCVPCSLVFFMLTSAICGNNQDSITIYLLQAINRAGLSSSTKVLKFLVDTSAPSTGHVLDGLPTQKVRFVICHCLLEMALVVPTTNRQVNFYSVVSVCLSVFISASFMF